MDCNNKQKKFCQLVVSFSFEQVRKRLITKNRMQSRLYKEVTTVLKELKVLSNFREGEYGGVGTKGVSVIQT